MTGTLNKYIVMSCSTEVNSNMFKLVIRLQRLSGPFWFSLFIPSICLIIAAEVALFIDDGHFEAMIMVSLTSNLVMYTLYSSIQADLPKDSSLKLIDIWLLHGLLMPMVVFLTLATNELVNSKMTTSSKSVKVDIIPGHEDNDKPSKDARKACIGLCKVMIPTISVLFILTFFFICLMK